MTRKEMTRRERYPNICFVILQCIFHLLFLPEWKNLMSLFLLIFNLKFPPRFLTRVETCVSNFNFHLVFLPEWNFSSFMTVVTDRDYIKYVLPRQSYEMHPAIIKWLRFTPQGLSMKHNDNTFSYLMRDQLGPLG